MGGVDWKGTRRLHAGDLSGNLLPVKVKRTLNVLNETASMKRPTKSWRGTKPSWEADELWPEQKPRSFRVGMEWRKFTVFFGW